MNKQLKSIPTFKQPSSELNISDVSDSVIWWSKLQPDEQQDLVEKYFSENSFGALAVDEDEVLTMYRGEHYH
jgi:hypothetical protein